MPYKDLKKRNQVVYNWRAKNRERNNTNQRKWYAKNREKMREYHKQWTLLKVGSGNKWRAWKEKYPERYKATSDKWRKEHPERIKYCNKLANLQRRKAGHLSIGIIQQVYEDNIKQYGTLTCVLCNRPIKFGQDNIEHKIPLVRGGTHALNNLAIAHGHCNRKKFTMTFEEWHNSKKEENFSNA